MSASPTGGRRETSECARERGATLEAMEASRRSAGCSNDADCAVVTGPGHPDREYAQVVAARDAPALDARALAHLETCGAFHHHEAIDAFRVVEATCTAGQCAATETIFHVDPVENG